MEKVQQGAEFHSDLGMFPPCELQKTTSLDQKEDNHILRTGKRSINRVTFNQQNEVAYLQRDGSFRVTYRDLEDTGQKLQKKLKYEYTQIHENTFENVERVLTSGISCAAEWDNPFQPEGELSQDAELILCLWREGRELSWAMGHQEGGGEEAVEQKLGEGEGNSDEEVDSNQHQDPPPPDLSETPFSSRESSGSTLRTKLRDLELDDKIVFVMLQLLRRLKFRSFKKYIK